MNILMLVSSFLSVILVQGYYYWKFKRFEQEAQGLVEEKVDEVISALKAEIPMADSFLRGSLDQKLRERAKSTTQNLLPALVKKSGSTLDWVVTPWIIALIFTVIFSWIYM